MGARYSCGSQAEGAELKGDQPDPGVAVEANKRYCACEIPKARPSEWLQCTQRAASKSLVASADVDGPSPDKEHHPNIAAPPPPRHAVDFTGKLILKSIDGDMDKFSESMDVSYYMRWGPGSASASNPVGSTTYNISHIGNHFDCEVCGTKRYIVYFVIGGGSQSVQFLAGGKMMSPDWAEDGNRIQLKNKTLMVRYYLPFPNEMYIESKTTNGVRVIEKFCLSISSD